MPMSDLKSIVIYHLVSGTAWFSGAALIIVAVLLTIRRPGRVRSMAARSLGATGLVLAILSATPAPLWACLVGAGLVVAWLVWPRRPGQADRKSSVALRAAAAGVCIAAVVIELPYHTTPTLRIGIRPDEGPRTDSRASGAQVGGFDHVYVIGDSISAGTGYENETPWPDLIGAQQGISVHNLSRGGATVASSLPRADRVEPDADLVVLEIGGNDMLRGRDVEEFERDLDELLRRLRRTGRSLLMLELPLPPFHNGYGASQRRLARAHGVALVPKRFFAAILTAPGCTIDGLHLSQTGHDRMARLIGAFLTVAE